MPSLLDIDTIALAIARDCLRLTTLTTQGRDRLDFHEHFVTALVDVLTLSLHVGHLAAQRPEMAFPDTDITTRKADFLHHLSQRVIDHDHRQVSHRANILAALMHDCFRISTLTPRNRDALDFYDLSVASVRDAITMAMHVGFQAERHGIAEAPLDSFLTAKTAFARHLAQQTSSHDPVATSALKPSRPRSKR